MIKTNQHRVGGPRQLFSLRPWISLCALSMLLGLWGCGGDEEEATMQRGVSRRRRAAPSAKKPTAAQSAAQGAVAQGQDISQRLTVPIHLKRAELFTPTGWDDFMRIRERLREARDPFWPDIPELKDQDEVEVDPSSVQRRLVVKVREFVQNLEFKGSLTGTASSLAMLEDNAGTGYSVRVGDIIGKPPEYVRVKLITNNRIFFEPVLGIPEDEPPNSPRLVKALREEQEIGLRGEQ